MRGRDIVYHCDESGNCNWQAGQRRARRPAALGKASSADVTIFGGSPETIPPIGLVSSWTSRSCTPGAIKRVTLPPKGEVTVERTVA
jgi:hypothetical protein